MVISETFSSRKSAITLLMWIFAAFVLQMYGFDVANAAILRRGQLLELRQTPSQSFSEFLAIPKTTKPLALKSIATNPMKTVKAAAPLAELIEKDQQSFASLVALVEKAPAPIIESVVKRTVEAPKVDVAALPKLETPVELQQIALPSEPKLGALSSRQSTVQVSVDEPANTEIVNATESDSDFVVNPIAFRSSSLRLRLIDDRSSLARNKIYPLANVKISIVGQKFSISTDRLGFAEIDQIPDHARVLLNIHDEFGRVRDSSIEVLVDANDSATKVITLMRHQALETYEAALAVPPTSDAAILCGVVVDQSEQRNPQQGLAIGTDTDGIVGPLYFNKYGFLDRAQHVTGPDGRFCMFNVSPGPTAVHVFQDDTALSTVIVGTFPGSTQHVELTAFDIHAMSTSIGVVASAHEQLGSDPVLADSVKLVDMVDLFPIGRGEPMTYTDAGHLEVVDGTTSYLERSFALVQSGEFENALYELSPDRIDRSRVSIMHPRGFLEDMALYAQISLNPQLGSVVFEHASFLNEDLGVDVMLTDSFGNEVGDGWYYSDIPRTKAIFFNLAPGTYNITVKSKSGEWVANDVVHVFNETITMVNTGSPLSERAHSQQ